MKTIRIAVGCIVLAGMARAATVDQSKGRADADGKTVWYDGQLLPLEGRAFQDTESFYDRLPARAQKTVPAPVWGLSHNSAGLAFRFVSDAPGFKVRWAVRSASLAMPHMPATGVSGVDVYRRTPEGWRFVKNGKPTAVTNVVEVSVAPNTECLVYLPLYNGTALLEVGIPPGKTLGAAPARPGGRTKPAVFYGTSITQGGCASRPGLAFTAVAGRLADVSVVNLGFSGNGKMELALCDLVAEIDASVYVLDCLWNMNDDLVKERAEPFIRALRQKRPDTPILLAEDCNAFEQAPTAKARILRGIYDKLKAEDAAAWKNLHYLEAKEMLGHDGEGTVDGCHPNDLGMMRQGQVFGAALLKVLGGAGR
jgi:lysophospholipase L1-like esterase